MKENMSSSNSAEHSCEFRAREDSARPGECKVTKDSGVLLLSGHRKCSEEQQRPAKHWTSQTLHTPPAQQGSTLVFYHQRQLYLAPAHTANASHPKAVAVWPLCHSGAPAWFSFRSFPLLQNTRNSSMSHKQWLLALHEQDEVICLLDIRLTCQICLFHSQTSLLCLWACPALFCTSCFNSSSPPELHRCQIPITPSQIA